MILIGSARVRFPATPATLVVLALITASCGGDAASASQGAGAATAASSATPRPAATPAATSTPTPSPTPNATPVASTATAAPLCAVESQSCSIEAGAYAPDFEPAFTFVITEAMTNERNWPQGGGIHDLKGGMSWAANVDHGTRNGKEVTFDRTAAGFTGYLKGFDNVEVTEGDPVSIDGTSAVVLDFATGSVSAPGLFRIAQDEFNLVPGEKDRFIVLERDGSLVVFVIGASAEADFDEVIATWQPVLDSVRWID